MKKLISIILAVFLTFSVVACNGDGIGSETPPLPVGTITDNAQHYYTRGLHKFNMTTTDIVFAENGKTDYKIVLSQNPTISDNGGASYLTRFVLEAMGATIPTVSEDEVEYSADAKLIVFNCPDLFEDAGLTMTSDDIAENGYYIKSAGKSVFVMTKDQILGYGARNAGLEILHQMIGLEFFSGDSYSYNCKPGDKIMLPGFDITDAPDITWNHYMNNPSAATRIGLRGTENIDLFMSPIGAGAWHNTLGWLPPNDANAEQKEYWYNGDRTELCYTAHGNQAMLDEMIRRCTEKAIASVDANPSKSVLTITLMDGGHYCTCDACSASKAAYGGADSAAHIKFVNRIGKGLDDHLTAKWEEEKLTNPKAEKRDVNLIFFAYNQTTNPPVKEVNGELVPYDDSVILYPNVGVWYAPIGMQYNESLYADVNSAALKGTRGWNVLTDNIYVWFYGTNFSAYLFPFNTWSTIPESYRCFAENDVKFMFNQGQFNQGQDASTGFSIFKEYLHHQLRWDCNQSYADLTNRFFNGYFKEAVAPMRRYFDELCAHLEYLESAYPTQINGSIYHNPTGINNWPLRTIKQWIGYIDEAYELIEPLKKTDPAKYTVLYNNINKESIFPRYALLSIHEGTFSSSELVAERLAFKADCTAHNITRVNEGGLLTTIYEGWGI